MPFRTRFLRKDISSFSILIALLPSVVRWYCLWFPLRLLSVIIEKIYVIYSSLSLWFILWESPESLNKKLVITFCKERLFIASPTLTSLIILLKGQRDSFISVPLNGSDDLPFLVESILISFIDAAL